MTDPFNPTTQPGTFAEAVTVLVAGLEVRAIRTITTDSSGVSAAAVFTDIVSGATISSGSIQHVFGNVPQVPGTPVFVTNLSAAGGGGGSLPAGAATAAKQDTGNSALAAISAAVTGTVAISAAALPLPTGAATAALQTSGNVSLTAIAAALAAALPLPTGASTAALQTTGNTSLATIATAVAAATPAGTNLMGKVGIDQTTPGTTNGVVINSLPSQAFYQKTTITRSNNVTAYPANGVVGGALDLGVLGPSGGIVMINFTSLMREATAILSGETTYRLHLYNVTPPSALADNATWDLPSGDRASYLGYVDLGAPVDLGSTLYVQQPAVGIPVKLSGTHLFGYLTTIGGYTPTAQLVYDLGVHTMAY